MAGSVNKVILIGNLGRDPEIRHLENGAVVANFPIATSESFRDRNTNELREQTEWHNIVVWRGLAEVVQKYVFKGTKVYIEGKLRSRSYQDKDNITRYTTEIVADNLTILTPKNENQTQSGNRAPYSNEGVPQSPQPINNVQQPQNNTYPTSPSPTPNFGDFSNAEDDDLPF